jgi:two-component system, NtrC family, sensor kinase
MSKAAIIGAGTAGGPCALTIRDGGIYNRDTGLLTDFLEGSESGGGRIPSHQQMDPGKPGTHRIEPRARSGPVNHNEAERDKSHWELAAETVTVRIRWFGLCVGYVLVNFLGTDGSNRPVLNAILTLGAVYAIIDTVWSLRGKVFLATSPLVISLMEAVFIGLLCYFNHGVESPFRFYYFLSLLVCAIRHSPAMTYSTFALHAISFTCLTASPEFNRREDGQTLVLTLILLGWGTWGSMALASLLKSLNEQLKENQQLLEERIQERTRELQESQAQLVQQEKQAAFGLLAAGIAHEVGNPLAAISSLVQMLKRRQNDTYAGERLDMVDDQLRRIQRTLRELVDFSRPATKERRLCDIHEILDAALNIAKYYKRKKGKRIVTRYAEDLPRLRAIHDQLVQVFLNLILNALDATSEGGTIELSTELRDGWIRVAVRDDGHGIDEADRRAIFQPYFTTKETGTGLGLFVCRKILEETGEGRIELTDTSPQGTTFTVFLSSESSPAQSDVPPTLPVPTQEVSTT